MAKISAIVINYNQADLLDSSLSSLEDFADEVVVVDLESTDNSKKVAEKYEAQVISHKRVEVVEEIRQKMLVHAKHDYVLFLDPDESITEEFKSYVKKVIEEESPDYFEIPRKNIIFGSWMRHSRWWPDYQVRLFKKNHINWPTNIHAQPEISGHGHQMMAQEQYAIIHHNYQHLAQYLEKNIRYAKKDAQQLFDKETELTISQTTNKALSEFISRYFAGHGYRDGLRGFVLAWLQMFYYFLVLFFHWELRHYPDVSEKIVINESSHFFKKGTIEVNHWKDKVTASSFISRIKNKLLKMLV